MQVQRISTTHVALILTELEVRRMYALAVDASYAVPPGKTRAMLNELVLVLEPAIGAPVDEARG